MGIQINSQPIALNSLLLDDTGKCKITYPQVVPNLYEFLSSAENKIIYFKEYW